MMVHLLGTHRSLISGYVYADLCRGLTKEGRLTVNVGEEAKLNKEG